MKGLVAIVWRELAQRRFVWVAAAVASCVPPFLVPFVRGLHGLDAEDARASMTLFLSLSFLYGLSSSLAGTIIPAGIASRRIGFDFARPVSAVAIWGGTWIAVVSLALTSAAVVALPAALANRARLEDGLGSLAAGTPLPIGLWIIGFLLVAGVVQAASVALRSRSVLLLLDFLAVLACVFLVQLIARQDVDIEPLGTWTGLGAAGAIVLAATFAAVARGRTDVRRAHRAQSFFLWVSASAALALTGAWILWLLSLTPERVRGVAYVHPAPRGQWIEVEASSGRAGARFLFDSKSRQFLRMSRFLDSAVFSRDGRRAAWLDFRGKQPLLVSADLGESPLQPARRPLPWTETLVLLVLDPDGQRAAISNGREVVVLNLSDGKVIASDLLPRYDSHPSAVFVGDALRILSTARLEGDLYRVELFSLDIASSRLSHTGTVDSVVGWPYSFSSDASGKRLIVKTRRLILLADATDGRRIATLSEATADSRDAAFASEGRVVVAERAGGSGSLRCVSAQGTVVWTASLPGSPEVTLGGEIRPGELIVGVGPHRDQEILAADLTTGALRPIGEHLSPAIGGWAFFFAPLDARPLPGEPATRLFYGPGDSLVRFDPETGERRVLLGGVSPE
jgi:hypothetical protein